jgi:hypothetical protein
VTAVAQLVGRATGRFTRSSLRLVAVALGLTTNAPHAQAGASTINSDVVYAVTYQTSWEHGIDPAVVRQEPHSDAIKVVPVHEFHGAALRVEISKSDDFRAVANGSPRAELAFAGLVRFAIGKEYEVRWSTLIPRSNVLDRQQPEIITQIHQSSIHGAPPFSLGLMGENYRMEVRGAHAAKVVTFGNAESDKGRVVSWLLRYRPDDTGLSSVTDLYKDGELVVRAGSIENSYPDEKNAYLKIGVYKWDWMNRPSAVDLRTMFFGNLSVGTRDRTGD